MMNLFDSILDTAERMIQSGVHALRDSVPRKLFDEMELMYKNSKMETAELDDVFQRVCRELKKLHALDQFASHIGLKEIELRVTDMTETTQAVEFTIDWDVDKAVEAFAALGIKIKFPDEVVSDDIANEAEKAMDSEPPTLGLETASNNMIQERVKQHMTALGYNAMYFADDKGTLTAAGENSVATGLSVLLDAVTANNYEKGWRTPVTEELQGTVAQRNMGELIALLHSEVSEAFEAYRNNEPALWFEHDVRVNGQPEKSGPGSGFADQRWVTNTDTLKVTLGKPQGIASELADVLIRLVDMAQEHDIPLIDAVIVKHQYNQTRPFRHGGKAC